MGEVTSAQTTIERVWPAHAGHNSGTRRARWSTADGVVCACGDHLGWPDPEHRETYSQYTKRMAKAQVDAASAPGRVQGAFGTYSRPAPGPEDGEPAAAFPGGDNAPEPGDHPDPEIQEPPRHDDDPGPAEPEDAEVDWGEPPADEPEPEVLVIEDGDGEDVGTAPFPAGAVPDERGNMIFGGLSYGRPVADVQLPADEAQAEPWGVAPVAEEPPPWHGVDDAPEQHGWAPGERTDAVEIADGSQAEYAVGDQVTVAGMTFTKHSESPFPEHNREPEKPSNEGIGSEVVPYSGTPIVPTAEQELDPLTGRLAPLDPTLPYTPADVEIKIVEIMRQMENSEVFLRQQLARLHQAQHNLDFRYNLAIAKSDARSADQRKAEAWIATERERFEATQADMLVRALRDSQHNLRAQLSGFQSVARSLAVSMVNALDGRERPPLPPEPPRWN